MFREKYFPGTFLFDRNGLSVCSDDLFFTEKYVDGHPRKIEILPEFVLDKAFVWVFDVLGQVGEEREFRRSGG